MSKNPVHHKRSKHIGMRHHFLREKVEDGTISLDHVRSEENLADVLTKGLPKDVFEKHRENLGVTLRLQQVGVSE